MLKEMLLACSENFPVNHRILIPQLINSLRLFCHHHSSRVLFAPNLTFLRLLLPPANEVCEGYVFRRAVILFTGGLQAHTQGGGVEGSGWEGSPGPHPGREVEGSGWGASRPRLGRGVSRPIPGSVSQLVLYSPPSRRLLLRVVRILLECILVY